MVDLFLFTEKPFRYGDIISIDLEQFDNTKLALNQFECYTFFNGGKATDAFRKLDLSTDWQGESTGWSANVYKNVNGLESNSDSE